MRLVLSYLIAVSTNVQSLFKHIYWGIMFMVKLIALHYVLVDDVVGYVNGMNNVHLAAAVE